jgi:hypothetical protein
MRRNRRPHERRTGADARAREEAVRPWREAVQELMDCGVWETGDAMLALHALLSTHPASGEGEL